MVGESHQCIGESINVHLLLYEIVNFYLLEGEQEFAKQLEVFDKPLNDFLRYLSERIGSLVNLLDVVRHIGANPSITSDYLKLLDLTEGFLS